jgi:hypothetical protein
MILVLYMIKLLTRYFKEIDKKFKKARSAARTAAWSVAGSAAWSAAWSAARKNKLKWLKTNFKQLIRTIKERH